MRRGAHRVRVDFKLSTLEALIAEINRQGYRVNNLFQHTSRKWQANLTDGDAFWEFGHGRNAIAALSAALGKVR